MKTLYSIIVIGFHLIITTSSIAEEGTLVCPAVYLTCDGPMASEASRTTLHKIASTILAQHCFAQEAMRCYGESDALSPAQEENVLLRKKILRLQRKLITIQKSTRR